jgi:hypothetical protein
VYYGIQQMSFAGLEIGARKQANALVRLKGPLVNVA